MKEDQFWLLVSLKLSGEATAEDLEALKRYIREDPGMGSRLEAVEDYWENQPATGAPMKKGALQRHLRRLNAIDDPPARHPRRRRFFLFAAGIAALLGGVFILLYQYRLPAKANAPVAQNTVSTKPGSKSKIQLPDGSQVWLNADSRIIYNEKFSGTAREVQLSGEAYFDIVKECNHPFIIHCSTIDVLVLGTTLNVRSYSNEKRTEAVLIRGSVEVTLRNHPEKKIILKPNDKLVVQSGGQLSLTGVAHRAAVDTSQVMRLDKAHFHARDTVTTEVLWVKNKLAFDQESLETVAMKIERWFNVKVSITEAALQQTEYSGVFEDESLPQVMEALRMTGNFHYTIHKRQVVIKP